MNGSKESEKFGTMSELDPFEKAGVAKSDDLHDPAVGYLPSGCTYP